MRVALEIPGESWTDLILETMGRKHVCAAALISQKWRRLPVSFPQFSASVWVSESPGVLRTTKGETQRDQYLGLPHRAARGRAAAAWVESTACPTKERDTRHFRPSQLPAVRGVPQRTQACGEQGPCWPVSVPGPLSGMQLLLPSAGHSQGPEGSTARHGTAQLLPWPRVLAREGRQRRVAFPKLEQRSPEADGPSWPAGALVGSAAPGGGDPSLEGGVFMKQCAFLFHASHGYILGE